MDRLAEPPDPIPAGMIFLPDALGQLAERAGDPRLVEPISAYRHMETGEIRLEPDPREVAAILERYADLALFALRAGYLSVYVDSRDHTLTPGFWQYSIARQCLHSGRWKDHKLLVSKNELNEISDLMLSPSDHAQQGVTTRHKPEPEPGLVIETAKKVVERRGPKPRNFWPKVLGYAAGCLSERGSAPDRQADLEKIISDRIAGQNDTAEASTVRSYAREMLDGYRRQLDGE